MPERQIPEGFVPLVAVEGTARECGRQYGEILRERYAGTFEEWLKKSFDLSGMPAVARKMLEARAPHLFELYEGLREVVGDMPPLPAPAAEAGCTSFGVTGAVTLDGFPISGQTKDTGLASAERYIVLRLRMQGAPTILTLTYPGDMVGYGMWSNGMSIFRNSLYSRAPGTGGLSLWQWALLALSGSSVHEAAEIARRFGLRDTGNGLLSDGAGESLSVEFNAGGVGVVPARDGIATHANHPVAVETTPWEQDPGSGRLADSRRRMERLRELLQVEAGRLTPQRALQCLADHANYPNGLCRHGSADLLTTAAVVAEPTRGLLHVVRGQPCANWPVTYTV
jgi:isopenicillin-N N-acyltransferase-like protein